MSVKNQTLDKIQKIDFDNIFVIDEKKQTEYSYNAFFSCCLSIAKELENRKENSLFVVLENGIDLFSLYFAAIMAQKKIIVADPEKGNDELHELLSENPDAFPIVLKKDFEKNTDILECFRDAGITDVKGELLSRFENFDFDSGYLTTFTSGTSGKTKGVVNSLNNLFGTTFSFEEKLDVEENGTFLHLMPMTYMAGILNSIFMPFIMGYRIVVGARFSVRMAISFWTLVEKYNVNFLWMSPMMLTMVDKVDRSSRYEEYCRKHKICFLIGTAPLSIDVRHNFEKRYGVMLQASYGLSETLFISVETKQSIERKTEDNVGEILSGVDYRITEDKELQISVPWMFKGYTNESTDDYFNGEYYMSGDLAKVNDGVLSIVGRKKDLIIRGGLNISPKLIEDVISQLNFFVEFSVFGKKNGIGEEEVCCAYVLDSSLPASDIEKKVSSYVIQKLGNNYSINSFIRMESLPRNINGKIDKNILRGI